MPHLAVPTVDVRDSFLAAMAEFRAEGRGAADDNSSIGVDLRGGRLDPAYGFDRYVGELRADSLPSTPRPPNRVACTTLWWVEGDEYLGRIAIRHELTEWLREYGGHIGYDVRPTARLRGHATAMLRAALPVAHELGIEQALVTCDDTNVGSRRVIENCGGRFEDQRGAKLRFWVPTAAAPPNPA